MEDDQVLLLVSFWNWCKIIWIHLVRAVRMQNDGQSNWTAGEWNYLSPEHCERSYTFNQSDLVCLHHVCWIHIIAPLFLVVTHFSFLSEVSFILFHHQSLIPPIRDCPFSFFFLFPFISIYVQAHLKKFHQKLRKRIRVFSPCLWLLSLIDPLLGKSNLNLSWNNSPEGYFDSWYLETLSGKMHLILFGCVEIIILNANRNQFF